MVMSAVKKNKAEKEIWGICERVEQRQINNFKEIRKQAKRISRGILS